MIGFPLVTSQLGSITIRAREFSQWRGVHISLVVFYGSPNGVPSKRPSSLLRLLNEIQVDFVCCELIFTRRVDFRKKASLHVICQLIVSWGWFLIFFLISIYLL
ncbi:hypothetical protein EUGRSUZ_C03079 [Eucalyptus grandis]|uniref:Uncharacterized protein n=2 Tax=Eucalyptus grandis TaxID=71139 RepID=A0ACC3LHP9_EUCGR|nr:hypothetical protein EUGRSUZ_C03079 [Eucalyptus grandis]